MKGKRELKSIADINDAGMDSNQFCILAKWIVKAAKFCIVRTMQCPQFDGLFNK